MSTNHRVIIVGGGFGGLMAARALRRAPAQVTLVDKRNFHLFQPLLYQVASGGLSPGDVAAPLRWVLSKQRNVRVVLAEALDFDLPARKVMLDTGCLEYDTLILATGAETNYYGNDQWERDAPGLKTIGDATEIRRRVFLAFEAAECETDEAAQRSWLRFIVVGGGATGVELAGAIAEISRDTMRHDFRSIRPEHSEILLLEGAPRILGNFHPSLSEQAERSLIRLGVRCRMGVRIVKVDDCGVELETPSGRERIDARTILWAAGVRPSRAARVLAQRSGAETDRGGRLKVRSDLSLRSHPEVFVIGDAAYLEQDGAPLPAVAPVAMQQGVFVARAIEARLRGRPAPSFRYRDKGSMATIGRNHAIAELWGLRLHGRLAWLAWLFIHLMYLVGFENRLIVFVKWALQYFTFNRGARLITGKPDSGKAA